VNIWLTSQGKYMGRRKGELSNSSIDREFPHQVIVLASSVAGNEGGATLKVALEGLSVCGRHHSVFKDDQWHIVFCFSGAEAQGHIALMCGRFTRMYTWRKLWELYMLSPGVPTSNLQPRYNICPTTEVDAVVRGDDARAVMPMRWGLVPSWWSKPLKEMRLATFNARAETVAEKPMFRDSFKKRRCLIPASGYYEWKDTPEGKQPYYFTCRDGGVITIAGLWSNWKDKATSDDLKSCTMVITEPNKFVAEFHDRMPVILEAKDFEQWEHGNVKDAATLMKPAAEDLLQKWPVSKRSD
jgi:putative SOS response-associated peptidase YedK